MDDTTQQNDIEIVNNIVEPIVEDVIEVAANDMKIEKSISVSPTDVIEETANNVEIENEIVVPIIDGVIKESTKVMPKRTTDINTSL